MLGYNLVTQTTGLKTHRKKYKEKISQNNSILSKSQKVTVPEPAPAPAPAPAPTPTPAWCAAVPAQRSEPGRAGNGKHVHAESFVSTGHIRSRS